jgi:hypothetical protein
LRERRLKFDPQKRGSLRETLPPTAKPAIY